jgi:hypothetical protein
MRIVTLVAVSALSLGGCSASSGDDGSNALASSSPLTAAWGFSYSTPAGWKSQDYGVYTFLGSPSDNTAGIVMGRGNFMTSQEALSALQSIAKEAKFVGGSITEAPQDTTIGGNRAVTISFSALLQNGAQVMIRYITIFSEYETSLGVLAVTTPAQFESLVPKVNELLQSVKVSAPQVNQAAQAALAGTWTYISVTTGTFGSGGNAEGSYTFDAAGNYQYRWNSFYNVNAPTADGSIGTAGSVSGGSNSSSQGTYKVIGNCLAFSGTGGRFIYPVTVVGDGSIKIGNVAYRR